MVVFEFVVDVDSVKMVVVVVVPRGVAGMLLRNLNSAGRRRSAAVEENLSRQLNTL